MKEMNSLDRATARRATTHLLNDEIARFVLDLVAKERVSPRHAVEAVMECSMDFLAEEHGSQKAARRFAYEAARWSKAKFKG